MFTNYKDNSLNHEYYSYNFEISNFIIINNKNLKKFHQSESFVDKTNILIKELLKDEISIINKNGILTKINNIYDGIIKIHGNYFFCYKNNDSVGISYFKTINEEGEISPITNSFINFSEKINWVFPTEKNKRIYVGLLKEKRIKIFLFGDDESLLLSEKEILSEKGGLFDNFKNCTELKENIIITLDENGIIKWGMQENNKYYININKRQLSDYAYNILKIDQTSFVINHKDKITFFDSDLNETKTIKISETNSIAKSLFLFKDYILNNCIRGIAIISLKNKELIQYITTSKGYESAKLYLGFNNNILLFNTSKYCSIMIYKFIENEFIPIIHYKDIRERNKEYSYKNIVGSELANVVGDDKDFIIIISNSCYMLNDDEN